MQQLFGKVAKKYRLLVSTSVLLEYEEILSEIPNETTLKAFADDQSAMPLVRSVEELRRDLMN